MRASSGDDDPIIIAQADRPNHASESRVAQVAKEDSMSMKVKVESSLAVCHSMSRLTITVALYRF